MLEITADITKAKIYFLFRKIFKYLTNLYLPNFLIVNIQSKNNTGKIKAILVLKYSPHIIPIKYPNRKY